MDIFKHKESLRLFIAFKNGPYAIYSADEQFNEIYRSGASYKDSSILICEQNRFFIVKTNSGLFSINFCRESQETWFLVEEDPELLLTNISKTFMIAL